MKKMKVLLCGYYGGGNFGDEALLAAIAKCLKIADSRVQITALSGDVDYTTKRHHINAIAWPHFGNARLFRLIPYLNSAIKKQDIVIIGGGQLLQDNLSWKNIGIYMLISSLAKMQDKKVVFLGIGSEPVKSRLTQFILRHTARNVDYIVTRDEASANALKKMIRTEDIATGSDFVLNLVQKRKEKLQHGKMSIGFNLREYNFPPEKLEEVIKFTNKIAKRHNLFLLATEDDSLILQKILEKDRGRGIKIVDFEDHNDYLKFLRKLDVVVSMRLHFLIVSVAYGNRCIGLSYDPKVESFCKNFQQPYLKMADVSESGLMGLLGKLKQEKVAGKIQDAAGSNMRNVRHALKMERRHVGILTRMDFSMVILLIYCRFIWDLVKKLLKRVVA